jgi:hypothetical protein
LIDRKQKLELIRSCSAPLYQLQSLELQVQAEAAFNPNSHLHRFYEYDTGMDRQNVDIINT